MRHKILAVLGSAVLAVVVTVGLLMVAEATAEASSVPTPAAVQAVQAVPVPANCIVCHGFTGQGPAALPHTPQPAVAFGAAHARFYNFSHTRCGALGIFTAYSTALGWDYLLAPGYHGIGAGFYSGGPPVLVQHQEANGTVRRVGVFGLGQHPVADNGVYYLTRTDC